jgi:hypothetical protein
VKKLALFVATLCASSTALAAPMCVVGEDTYYTWELNVDKDSRTIEGVWFVTPYAACSGDYAIEGTIGAGGVVHLVGTLMGAPGECAEVITFEGPFNKGTRTLDLMVLDYGYPIEWPVSIVDRC